MRRPGADDEAGASLGGPDPLARGYGGVDVLDFRDVDRPRIGPDEALIRVRAAGVDRGTRHLMTGLPYLVRLASGLRGPQNPVPGLDVAGSWRRWVVR